MNDGVARDGLMAWIRRVSTAIALALIAASVIRAGDEPATSEDRNVVLVTADGLRWQEVFRGADGALLNREDGGVADVPALREAFWRESPEARREALMPFLWGQVARDGQLLGNAERGSVVRVANGKNFSYPGYNELLTGAPDDRVDSNDKRPNPNVSVLEWLHRKPAYRGRVVVVGSWDLYPYILNVGRSGLPINAGWEPLAGDSLTEAQSLLNRLMGRAVRDWEGCRNDVFTWQVALEHLRRDAPRVLYVALGDTDEYAHEGRYDKYLQAAHRFDAGLRELWEALQAHPTYRGKTTLVVTTDHGRGDPPRGWRDHGARVAGSEAIWLAAIGPDTPALGERSETEPITQGQVAATLAALLGEDFRADHPAAAQPVAEVLPGR